MPWVEAVALLEWALQEFSTPLFAAVNGWEYPVTRPEFYQLYSKYKDTPSLLPFDPDTGESSHVTEEQRRKDQAEVESEVIFAAD